LIAAWRKDFTLPASRPLRPKGLFQAFTDRWRGLDRGARVALVGITVLAVGAISVRVWMLAIYRPAFLGFSDSSAYMTAAARNVFRDPQHPAGYPLFLRLVHHLSGSLAFTIAVQHALGVASGLLLYKSVRRLGAPPWLGLLPSAVVFFGGTGLLLEHAPMADPLLTFLQSLAIYAVVRALGGDGMGWAALAGVATGASFWVKTVALSSALLVPIVLLFAVPGTRRMRALSASVAGLSIALLIFAYVGAQAYFTGWWGYERQSAWNLYARVATFVDCSHFTPPKGTAFLCPGERPSARNAPNYFQYDRHAPAVARYGGPAHAPPYANAVLQRFSLAAIEQQPLAYVSAIGRGLSYYVFPRAGEGYSPQAIRDALLDTGTERTSNSVRGADAVAPLYPLSVGTHVQPDAVSAISAYEEHTRIGGAGMIALLLAAFAGPFLLRGRARAAALFFGLTALLSITLAVATNSYDARYAYPTFGPLAASAALGGWAAAAWLRRRLGHVSRIRLLRPARVAR
jgi:hypothetical protein